MDANNSPGRLVLLVVLVLAVTFLGGCGGESRPEPSALGPTAASEESALPSSPASEPSVHSEPTESHANSSLTIVEGARVPRADPPSRDDASVANTANRQTADGDIANHASEHASVPRSSSPNTLSQPVSKAPGTGLPTVGSITQPRIRVSGNSTNSAAQQPFASPETTVLPEPRTTPLPRLALAGPQADEAAGPSAAGEASDALPDLPRSAELPFEEDANVASSIEERSSATKPSNEFESSELPETAPVTTRAEAIPLSRATGASAAPTNVEVFFATDRLPTSELIPSPLRTFAPAAVVGMICGALFIGFSLARRFYALWILGCGLGVCLGVTVLHTSIIRWQQYARLASNASTRFSPLRDNEPRDYPLHVGTARVSLPPTHQLAGFEQPQLLKFEFVETPKKHIVLHSLRVEESSAWFEEISGTAGESPSQAGFIFIHGYNVRFIDALKRTAQLANDLELHGPAICYSWPSRGEVAAYTADEATVSWSAPHFEQLLIDLHVRTQCRQIHVIAHSMGNRALLEAIERIDLRRPNITGPDNQPPAKLIDNLVMAAPDVDMQQFSSRYAEPLRNVAARATLYFSDDDRALQLSARIHGSTRLGFDKQKLRSLTGIEPILVETDDFLSLGHSYYGDDPAVIQDLRDLLHGQLPAAQRQLLRSVVTDSGLAYWQIDRGLHAQLSTIRNR